jgi:hypothetical protein
MSFTAITLCFVSQRVFNVVVVYFVMTQSGNFWIHPRIYDSKRIEFDPDTCQGSQNENRDNTSSCQYNDFQSHEDLSRTNS